MIRHATTVRHAAPFEAMSLIGPLGTVTVEATPRSVRGIRGEREANE